MNYYQSNYYSTNHYGSDYYGPDGEGPPVEEVTFFSAVLQPVLREVNSEVLDNDECC